MASAARVNQMNMTNDQGRVRKDCAMKGLEPQECSALNELDQEEVGKDSICINSEEPQLAIQCFPHKDLKLTTLQPLYHAQRVICEMCGNSIRYYCSFCMIPQSLVPPPKVPPLPFNLDIWKHRHENKGKSTAIHAKLIFPDQVQFWHYPDQSISYERDPEQVLLLYPSPKAKPLSEIPLASYSHVIVIDGTWYQAHQMVRDAAFLKSNKVRHVTFANPPKTSFWRFQQHSEQYLATIEAIWWLVREYQAAAQQDLHTYDDMLWYYTFHYQKILSGYQNDPHRILNSRLKGAFRQHVERTREL